MTADDGTNDATPRQRGAAEDPGGSAGTPDAVARELYAVAPGGFVAARDAAAARAREAGDRDAAARIKALRRPTVAAWAVNRLVADSPDDIDDLIDLGDRMRTAQRDLRGTDLRDLSAERGRRVSRLVRRATALARESGTPLPAAAQRDVETTLDAAVTDPEAASSIRRATLTKALSYTGTGFGPPSGDNTSQVITFPTHRTRPTPNTTPGPATDPATHPATKPAPGSTPATTTRGKPRPRRTRATRATASALEAGASESTESRPDAAAHEEAEARRAARRRAVAAAEQDVEKATRGRADARAALDTARERREAAIAERHRLRQDLSRAERAVTRADTRLAEATAAVDRAEAAMDAARTRLTTARSGRTTPESDQP